MNVGRRTTEDRTSLQAANVDWILMLILSIRMEATSLAVALEVGLMEQVDNKAMLFVDFSASASRKIAASIALTFTHFS